MGQTWKAGIGSGSVVPQVSKLTAPVRTEGCSEGVPKTPQRAIRAAKAARPHWGGEAPTSLAGAGGGGPCCTSPAHLTLGDRGAATVVIWWPLQCCPLSLQGPVLSFPAKVACEMGREGEAGSVGNRIVTVKALAQAGYLRTRGQAEKQTTWASFMELFLCPADRTTTSNLVTWVLIPGRLLAQPLGKPPTPSLSNFCRLHCSVALRIGGGSSSCPPLAPTCGCQGSVQQEATLQCSLLSPGSPTPACPMCAALSWKQRWLQAASNIAVSQASVMGRGQALFWAWISEPRRSLVLSSIRPWRKVSVLLWSQPGRSLCCHLPRSSPGTPCSSPESS